MQTNVHTIQESPVPQENPKTQPEPISTPFENPVASSENIVPEWNSSWFRELEKLENTVNISSEEYHKETRIHVESFIENNDSSKETLDVETKINLQQESTAKIIEEQKAILDEISIAMQAIKITTATVCDATAANLRNIGITIEESEQALECDKAIHKQTESFLRKFELTKTTYSIALSLGCLFSIYSVCRYLQKRIY